MRSVGHKSRSHASVTVKWIPDERKQNETVLLDCKSPCLLLRQLAVVWEFSTSLVIGRNSVYKMLSVSYIHRTSYLTFRIFFRLNKVWIHRSGSTFYYTIEFPIIIVGVYIEHTKSPTGWKSMTFSPIHNFLSGLSLIKRLRYHLT